MKVKVHDVLVKTNVVVINGEVFDVYPGETEDMLLGVENAEEAVIFEAGEEGEFCEDQDGVLVATSSAGVELHIECMKLVPLTLGDL